MVTAASAARQRRLTSQSGQTYSSTAITRVRAVSGFGMLAGLPSYLLRRIVLYKYRPPAMPPIYRTSTRSQKLDCPRQTNLPPVANSSPARGDNQIALRGPAPRGARIWRGTRLLPRQITSLKPLTNVAIHGWHRVLARGSAVRDGLRAGPPAAVRRGLLGGVVAVLGIVVTLVAQLSLGGSWCTGVAEAVRTDLVTTSAFRWAATRISLPCSRHLSAWS